MKRDYRGFELSAERGESLGGDTLLYYYILRKGDGWFLEDNFTSGDELPYDMIQILKRKVDDFYENPLPYYTDNYTLDEIIDGLLVTMQPGQVGAVFKRLAKERKNGRERKP